MWFKRKNKEKTKEEVLADMKAKNEQIEKLKEEINTMGKLIMVNGKLTKQEDKPVVQKQDVPQPRQEQQIEQVSIQQQQAEQQIENDIRMQMAMRKEYQEQLMREQQMQMERQQQEYQEQLIREQQMQMERQRLKPTVPPPLDDFPTSISPQQNYINVEQSVSTFQIEVVTGTIYEIEVSLNEIEDFVDKLNVSIDNQTSIAVGDRVINGRNIVSYTSK